MGPGVKSNSTRPISNRLMSFAASGHYCARIPAAANSVDGRPLSLLNSHLATFGAAFRNESIVRRRKVSARRTKNEMEKKENNNHDAAARPRSHPFVIALAAAPVFFLPG